MAKELKIESCRDCPRLRIIPTKHFLMGNQTGYIYRCTKAGRDIMPAEGVKPPPAWCPLPDEKDKDD